ncbi:MAG: DUF4058 family protein [Planctomycetaceae bacterium]
MPSPFPGMDPFLERQEWEDFHTTFNTVLREQLSQPLRPDYLIRVERRIYVEHVGPDPDTFRRADVAGDTGLASGVLQTAVAVAEPAICTLPMPEERRETYLVIRDREHMQVVTVIELLSPSNKRAGGDGQREYLKKRDEILSSPTHLVEIDLLRGGQRLPVIEPFPPCDYCSIVSRWHQRPTAGLYTWAVQQPLPVLPIPLKQGDADVPLPLQDVFNAVYDRAGYDLSVNYKAELDPPPNAETAEWITQRIRDATRKI